MSAEENFYRLPTDVIAYHYEISLAPDLSTFKFEGSENVHVEVHSATDSVCMNACELNIKNATFHTNNGQKIAMEKMKFCSTMKTVTIKFCEKLPVGKSGYLHLDFEGELNDSMAGFYRSKYTNQDGASKFAAITQFEAVDARKCFPCWDEPAMKATFDITLTVPVGLTALSNMPVKMKTIEGTKETLVFETSPKMSTYLLGIVVGEFDYVEDKTSSGIIVRVYTPKGKKEQGTFALHVAMKSLTLYNEYFKIPYPLPKLDLVAIPDFSAGAMENWGLITYRECRLLMDPVNTSSTTKQYIVTTVAHEIAHQWFGNLVTMKWWTHLWLNEGTAKFMEFLCSARIYPEYSMWTLFMTIVFATGLELDCLKKSHPVEVTVTNPDEIDEIFDDISYMKGASIIRMLHSYIGDEDFRKGMILYLKNNAYLNAETEDLWAALEAASNKPIEKIMSTWTKQTGFPLLRVEQRQNGADRILTLTQQRFLIDGSTDDEGNLWNIPISVNTSADPGRVVSSLMEQRTMDITIPNVPKYCWVKVNPGSIGFYRTHYSPEILKLFVPSIMDQTLPPLDRFAILGDCFALARSGQVSTVEILRLLQAYRQEDNYAVWSTIVNCLASLSILLGHLDIHEKFQGFCRDLLKDVMRSVGWDSKRDESHLDAILRSLVLGQMVTLQDEAVLQEAKRRFRAHLAGEIVLPADLRNAVYCAGMRDADAETLEKMMTLYRKTELHEERNRILAALGVVRDEDLLKQVLRFALSDEVRAQDILFVFPTATITRQGRKVTWNFVKDNWATFLERYKSNALNMNIVKRITDNFVTGEMAKEVKEFFAMNPLTGTERTVQQCVEKIQIRAAWLERDRKSIEQFLLSQD